MDALTRSLCRFEQIEKQTSEIDSIKQKISETQRSVLNLQCKLKALQEQKATLTNRITKFELKSQDQDSSKNSNETGQYQIEDYAVPKLTEKEVEYRILKELIDTYRLTGISVENIERNRLLLRFDTCSMGQFFEPYFVELLREDKSWSLFKHSLPYFIPITELVKKHLPNLEQFAFSLLEYLNAFVRRREEISNFQKNFREYLHKEVTKTDAYDYLVFCLSENSGYLEVELEYRGPTSYLPTRVSVNQVVTEETSTVKSETVVTWKEILKTFPLTEAVQRITGFEESSVEDSSSLN